MIRNIFFVIFFFFLCQCVVPVSWADDAALGGIDKNESYDIYYGNAGDGESFIVRRVKVVRIDRINEIEFLVFINDAGFNAKGKEGFILFSRVHAIVPSSTFTISGIERLKQY